MKKWTPGIKPDWVTVQNPLALRTLCRADKFFGAELQGMRLSLVQVIKLNRRDRTFLSPDYFPSHINMTFRCLSLALIAFWLSGCQSANELPGLGSDARQYEGQMIYNSSNRSIVGDVILRTQSNGDYDLVFSKTGVLVLQLQVHGNELSATGPMARTGFTGPIELAQGELRNWAHLKVVLPYFYTNDPSASGRGWTATFDRQGNRLTATKIEFGKKASMVFSFS